MLVSRGKIRLSGAGEEPIAVRRKSFVLLKLKLSLEVEDVIPQLAQFTELGVDNPAHHAEQAL
jgi:hypothetical protein